MRELNHQELEMVSGGFGFVGTIGGTIGGVVGGIIDSVAGIFGLKTNATQVGSYIGNGIGKIFDFDFSGAINSIGTGISTGISCLLTLFPPAAPATPATPEE